MTLTKEKSVRHWRGEATLEGPGPSGETTGWF